jgi:transcriptional regulator with XRE-family HTH domain
MTFSTYLQTERERLGLTQAQCALALEVSPRTVWEWERGEEPIGIVQEGVRVKLSKLKPKKTK